MLTATAGRAHLPSLSRPGFFSAGKVPPNRSGRMPTCGCNSTNQISEATAMLVATVDENSVRNTPLPRRCLSASTARPMPRARPIGTVINAKRERVAQRVAELEAVEHVDVLPPPGAHDAVLAGVVAAQVAEPDRPAERVEDEHAEDEHRRHEHDDRQRQVTQLAPPAATALRANGVRLDRGQDLVSHGAPQRSRRTGGDGPRADRGRRPRRRRASPRRARAARSGERRWPRRRPARR